MCTSVYIITYVTIIPTLRASSIVVVFFFLNVSYTHYVPIYLSYIYPLYPIMNIY